MFKEKLVKFFIKGRGFFNFFTHAALSLAINGYITYLLFSHHLIDEKFFPFFIFTVPGGVVLFYWLSPLMKLAQGLINLSLKVNTNPFISEKEELGYAQNKAFVRSVFWAMFLRKNCSSMHFPLATGEHLTKVEDLDRFNINENYLNKLWLQRDHVQIYNNLMAAFREYFPLFEKEGFLGFYTKQNNPYLHYTLKFWLLCHRNLFFTDKDLIHFQGTLPEADKITDTWVIETLFSHDIYTQMPNQARVWYRAAVKAELLVKYQAKLDLWEMELSQKDFIPMDNLLEKLPTATTDVENSVIEEDIEKLDISSLPINIQQKFNTLITLCAQLQKEKEYVDIQVMPDVHNIHQIILPKYLELFKSYKGPDDKFLAGLVGIERFLMKAQEQMLIQKNSSFESYQAFIEQKFSEHMEPENLLTQETHSKTLNQNA